MSKLAHSHQHTMDQIEARRVERELPDMDAEATIFAAHLLIPEQSLAPELAQIGAHDIDDDRWLDALARKFKVTRGLMQLRLRMHAQLSAIAR